MDAFDPTLASLGAGLVAMSKPKPQIRASMLPGLSRCRAMWRESRGLINPGSDASREGTMWHAVKDVIIAHRAPLGETDTALIAAAHGFTVEQVEYASARLAFLADIPADWEPMLERHVMGAVPGTFDVFFLSPDGLRGQLFDLKSGRNFQDPAETNLQTINYAIGAMEEFPTVQEIDVFLIYPRLGETSRATFTREQLIQFRFAIDKIVMEAERERPEYTVGTACEHCAAARTCPALNREVARSVFELSGLTEQAGIIGGRFTALDPAAKGRVLCAAKAAIKLANEIVAAAKLHAPLDLGNGDVFQAVETKERSIDPLAAWPTLTTWLGDKLGEVVKVPMGAAKAGAVDSMQSELEETGTLAAGFLRTVKGEAKINKAAVEREFMKALDAAGAIKTEIGTEYRIIKGGLNHDNGNAGNGAEAAAIGQHGIPA